MKRNAIVRIIIFSLIIVMLLGILLVGLGVGLYTFRTDTQSDAYILGGGEVPAREIREIEIEWTSGDITIQTADIDTITFQEIGSEDSDPMVYRQNGDKLIIGKFCQIAAGVEFVMNGANHQMNAVSTFPFYTLEGWNMAPPAMSDMPLKGDTIIGKDVWIGQNAVILPGVHIGDGAIIGANRVVGRHVAPYTIVAGNPAKEIHKRFDDELIDLMCHFKWWDKSVEEIERLIPVLTNRDLETVKAEIKRLVEQKNTL